MTTSAKQEGFIAPMLRQFHGRICRSARQEDGPRRGSDDLADLAVENWCGQVRYLAFDPVDPRTSSYRVIRHLDQGIVALLALSGT
ncbi:hypothetical protein [Lichenifustis flavocetrariae]|uniref:hypothetical protein n=1 Tax=Lichenifustis flavocetrariae TaxID=2949735 RepID=UPI0024A728E2|nr:hypothetical protein [Lichenifustis flavocetrariae]